MAGWRRITGFGGILAGSVLVVGTLAIGGLGAAAAGERLLDLARPELTETGLTALRSDFTRATTANDELQGWLLPTYAAAEGRTAEAFGPEFTARYPDLAAAAAAGPDTIAFTDRAITNLERHQHDFEQADDIPLSRLPLDVAPSIMLVLGAGLIVAGGLALRSAGRASSGAVWALGAIGALLVVFTLATSAPAKSAAADRLIGSLNITPQTAADTRARLDQQVAGAQELETLVLPDLQARLGLSDAAFDELLRQEAPTVAGLRGNLSDSIRRFEIDARVREEGHDEFAAIRDVPIRALPWVYVASGVVAVLAALVSVVAARRRTPVTAAPGAPVTPATPVP
jgi:hypothetical protein